MSSPANLTFVQQQPTVVNGGDVGGDTQSTDSYSVRYLATTQVDGLYAVVEEFHYGSHGDVMADPEALQAQAQSDGSLPFALTVQRGYTLCTDPADPGGTEVWADYRYQTDEDACFATLAEAQSAAYDRALASSAAHFSWNGAAAL